MSRIQFIRTDLSLLPLKLLEESLVVLQLTIADEVLKLLVLLVPAPLVDLRLSQPGGF